jgi:tetratricopeptide (TPR) repeat protein
MLLALPFAARPAAAARPVEFPMPELPVTVVPLSLNLARPPLDPPAPPPVPAPTVDLGAPPLPRFLTAVPKPSPPARESSTACAFGFGRPAARAECGIHRVLQGDLRGAREALEDSVQRDPRGAHAATAYVWLAEIAVREGRLDEAERRYRTALALNPPADLLPSAALGAGWVALRRGDLTEAERQLAAAGAAGAPPAGALVARFLDGVGRLLAGRPDEALPLWDGVAAAGPPPAVAEELLFWRGVALARLRQSEPALQALDSFLATVSASHPLRADAIVQSGWVALDRGMPDDAVRRFLWAQGAGPRAELMTQLRAGLVRAYLGLGDPTRAQETARLLAADSARDPLLPPVLLLIADDAARRNATGEAVDTYRQLLAVQLDPRLTEYATYRLAEGVERQGGAAEAERHYRVLRETGKVEAIAQRAAYRLGLLALRAGRPGDARSEGEALLQAGVLPELREGLLILTGEGAARGNDANRAAALFRLVLRDFPASPRAGASRLALGWALFKDGEPESALREWEEARLATDFDVAVLAYLAIAEVALRQGHEAQSLAALQELGKLAPSHPLADTLALNRGILLVRAKEYERAVQELEPLTPRIQAPALQALLRRALGVARYHLSQFDAAEQQFGWAAYWAPAEPSNSLGAGLAALARNQLSEAEKALGVARLATAPEVAVPASYALVLAAVRRRDDQLFRERATGFVDRYPTHPYAALLLYGLARTALDGGEVDAVETWVKRLLHDQPTSEYVPDALTLLAEAAAQQRPALARQTYAEILARARDGGLRGDAWLGLAEAALALGDGLEAERALDGFLREAPADDPRGPRALALMIRAQDVQGRRDRAVAAADTFLARFPAHPLAPAIQLTRGHYLVIAQQWDAARQALEAARDTGEPAVAAPAHVYLGELHRARGEHEAAIAAYLGATYLYPESPPWAARGLQGAIQSYLARQMPREASILLKKLVTRPGVEPDLTQWARRALTQLGPITGEDPSEVLRKGPARP